MKSFSSLLVGLLVSSGFVTAQPVPPPPAVGAFAGAGAGGAAHRARPAGVPVQYSIGDPTDEEQFYLELLNRARMNPTAEGIRLANTKEPNSLGAYQFFGVDRVKLQADLAAIPPLAPLAFEPHLLQVARSHSQWMFSNGIQGHDETSPPGSANVINTTESRITNSGYPAFTLAGESVFAFAANAQNGHDAYEVDWGSGPGGVQDPPGHRINNHTAGYREIGVGVVNGRNTVTNIVGGVTNIGKPGPQVVSFEFGGRQNPQPLVTGVAYYDLNGNQFYDLGEGVSGITVNVSGDDNFAVTSASGGFAVPAVNGPCTVTFSGLNLVPVAQAVVISGASNLKVDLQLAYVPPVVGGTLLAKVDAPTVYSTAPVAGATSYHWEYAKRQPFTASLGAESGAGDFTASISQGYSVISTEIFRSGAASYHLVQPNSAEQSLTLTNRLRATATSLLIFSTRLEFATTNQFARAQVTTNQGVSWITVWEQMGRTNLSSSGNEATFTTRTNSLAAFADLEVAVRLTYSTKGSFFTGVDKNYGIFFDELGFADVDELAGFTSTNLAVPAFAFTPPSAGNFALQVRPQIGAHSFQPGPWFFLSTTVGTPPSVQLALATNGPGTVVVSPAGGVYSPGASVSLTATPAPGSLFLGWSGGVTSSANPLPLTLNASLSVVANFSTTFSLATSVNGQGSVALSPQKPSYPSNDLVTLTAVPAPGWVFVGWSGDLGGSLNPTNLLMNANKSVTATFLPVFTLTTSVTGQGSLTVSPQKSQYLSNEVVTLTAAAAPGWAFVGWSGDLGGFANPTDLVLNANKSVTATFLPVFTLVATLNGNATGTVSPQKSQYFSNEVVTLTVAAAPGWVFVGWSGDLGGSLNPTNLVMNANKSVTANFLPTYTLTTTVTGQGTVTLSPPKSQYLSNDVVTLTAAAAPGWAFVGWSGDLGGSSSPTNLVMNVNKSVTANFLPTYTLTTTVTGQGTVTLSPPKPQYLSNDVVTLTAAAAPGWAFVGWSGDLGGSSSPTNLVMNANKSVTANFQILAPPVLGNSAVVLGPSGNLRVDFSVVSGTATSFILERAPTPLGVFSSQAATLATNSPGHFSFKQILRIPPDGFFRVRAQ